MTNKFKGEKELELGGINYKMIVDMDVIAEFESETGVDLMNATVKAINAMIKTRPIKNALERAEIMTSAVSRKDAAWLFYLAAKKANSHVEFGEIQEALMREGPIDGENISYPILFAVLLDFTVTGGIKKKSTQSNS